MLTTAVVGMSHRVAPVEVRERLAPGQRELPEALALLTTYAPQGAILSTCNRTEVYGALPNGGDPEPLVAFLCDYRGVTPEGIGPHLYAHTGAEAVRHLFRVASSLDSMVLGEAQILGQVRVAGEEARQVRATGTELDRLFRHAVVVGRRARSETAIGRNAASVSSASLDLARRLFGTLAGRRVLVVSAGQAGKLAVRALQSAGVAGITVTNRTYARAVELADQLGGTAVPFSALGKAVAAADIVISASGSPGYVIRPALVKRAMASRGEGQPLLIVDIAVPRDVDPAVVTVPGVALYNIDDLHAVSNANRRRRESEVEKVEAIVDDETGRFLTWWRSREAAPTIIALQRETEAVRQRELKKAMRKLPGLAPNQVEIVEAMSRSIARKLLHRPIASLKEGASDGAYLETVRRLFTLPPDGEDRGPS